MNEMTSTIARRLRERAQHCRELARRAVSVGLAGMLESVAAEYDRDAARLEIASLH